MNELIVCPECNEKTLTVWTGQKGRNVTCTNNCHALDDYRRVNDILAKLDERTSREGKALIGTARNVIGKDDVALANATTVGFKHEYLSLSDLGQLVASGAAFSAPTNGRRNGKNFISRQDIALDFDNIGKDRIRQISYTPESLKARCTALGSAWLVYHTASSTPDWPKMRAVTYLDRAITNPAEYTRIYTALASQFDGIDTHCNDAVHAFYGAVDCQWEVFGQGQACADDLLAMVPEREKPIMPTYEIANLAQEAKKAQAALKRLDPQRCDDYGEWVQIGMSLRQLGDNGLVLWDEWSKGSAKYRPGECADKWAGFDAREGGRRYVKGCVLSRGSQDPWQAWICA